MEKSEENKEEHVEDKFSFSQLTNTENGKTSPFIIIPLFVLLFAMPLLVYTVVIQKDIPMVQQVVAVILGVLGTFGVSGFIKRKI